MPYNNRDDIADTLMQQQGVSPLGQGLAGLAGAMPANMPTAMPTGMPQTPAGGVPGSGMAQPPPGNMALPPMQPAPPAQGMGTMPELSQIPWMGGQQGMPQQAMPQARPQGMMRRRAY